MALVAALASGAELLILDEPTSGLDPLMEAVFQDCIREVRAEGRTVLLSSHILAEVEALCDRVSIIRAGRTVQIGTLDELRQLTRTTRDRRDRAPGRRARRRRRGRHWSSARTGGSASTSTPTTSAQRSALLGEAGIQSLVSHPPTLEELFLRQYGDRVEREPEVRP